MWYISTLCIRHKLMLFQTQNQYTCTTEKASFLFLQWSVKQTRATYYKLKKKQKKFLVENVVFVFMITKQNQKNAHSLKERD